MISYSLETLNNLTSAYLKEIIADPKVNITTKKKAQRVLHVRESKAG